ncbi:MAG: hypothetical protein ACJ77E_19585 [Gaiellaceae bacterium]
MSSSDLTYDQAVAKLLDLARARGGTLTAAQVEADESLSNERDLVSAAARALAGGTNVFSSEELDGREWFPFSTLTFSELRRD